MKRMKFIHLRDCFRYLLAMFAFGGAKRIVPNMTVPWHISKPQSLVLHSDLLDMPLTEKVGPGQHRCWSKVTNQGWMPLKKESMGNNWNKWKRCKQSRPNIASIFFSFRGTESCLIMSTGLRLLAQAVQVWIVIEHSPYQCKMTSAYKSCVPLGSLTPYLYPSSAIEKAFQRELRPEADTSLAAVKNL